MTIYRLDDDTYEIDPGPTWDADWESAKQLAREFCQAHNADAVQK